MHFLQKTPAILRTLMSGEGIYPLKEIVASFINLAPTDVAETMYIIGLASYYRKLIANFSDIVRLLTELTTKNTSLNWSPLCQVSFNSIKITLTNSPILVFPSYKSTLCIIYRCFKAYLVWNAYSGQSNRDNGQKC